MKSIIGKLKDRPLLVTGLIVIIIAVHAFLVREGMIPDWSKALRKKNESTDLYLAMLSAASLQAGFAGVVVVFGLSAQPKAFKNLRIAAGNALVDNWISISYSGFLSAGCSLAAALINILGDTWLAPWFFEASILFCIHGTVRLLWLFKQLIRVVCDADSKEAQQESERK